MKINREKFWKSYLKNFGRISHENFNNLTRLLDSIEEDSNISRKEHMAYMLATVHHETYNYKTKGRYAPITELGGRSYFNKYDAGTPIGERLGNIVKGDGYKFRGRGYVQLTGRANYERLGDLLRLNLVELPDLALDPTISYSIMSLGMRKGLYTGRKLSDYDLDNGYDYLHARRIINGMDRAKKIAQYAKWFEEGLE